VNTRLQVEHPITEITTGVDLIRLQIEIAEGKTLPFSQKDIFQKNHAIELRLCAENPQLDFQPQIGKILKWKSPAEVRTDSGVESGSEITPFYDSMIAKLIISGKDRQEAIRKSIKALQDLVCVGIQTNQEFLKNILQHPDFQSADFDTQFIALHPELAKSSQDNSNTIQRAAIASLIKLLQDRKKNSPMLSSLLSGWRNNFYAPQSEKFLLSEDSVLTIYYRWVSPQKIKVGFLPTELNQDIDILQAEDDNINFIFDNQRFSYLVLQDDKHFYTLHQGKNTQFIHLPRLPEKSKAQTKGAYFSPLPGEVIKINVGIGQKVEAGEALLVINSMKMENTVYAHSAGLVEEIWVEERQLIQAQKPLLKIQESD
jgi:acetyl/propionyl-CoA carboxylase alpha subunit